METLLKQEIEDNKISYNEKKYSDEYYKIYIEDDFEPKDASNSGTQLIKHNNLQHTSPQNSCTKKSRNYSSNMITWIGFVQQIKKDEFSAHLHNMYENETDIVADFSINDVMDDDRCLIEEGACFYYSIGYVYENGQRKKEAILKFKRIVNFTVDDVVDVQSKMESWKNNINWE